MILKLLLVCTVTVTFIASTENTSFLIPANFAERIQNIDLKETLKKLRSIGYCYLKESSPQEFISKLNNYLIPCLRELFKEGNPICCQYHPDKQVLFKLDPLKYDPITTSLVNLSIEIGAPYRLSISLIS